MPRVFDHGLGLLLSVSSFRLFSLTNCAMSLILSSEWVSICSWDVIARRRDYVLEKTRTDAQKEFERIEQELNAKAAPPADVCRIARVNRKQPHLYALLNMFHSPLLDRINFFSFLTPRSERFL